MSQDKETTVMVREDSAILDVSQVGAQVNAVHDLMKRVMKKDEDYGIIPGCKKPSLYKPGAEKLGVMFRLAPSYDIRSEDLPGGHREVFVTCILTHINSGRIMGQGAGSCSTLESKYRYRGEGRTCPECGQPTIIKGRDEFGGGWLCFKKKGGCGAKFKDGDEQVESQEGGKVENPDPADQFNTVLKMAQKRANVAATLSATAASSIFTQDVEDLPGAAAQEERQPVNMPTEKRDTISDPQRKRMLAIAGGAKLPPSVLRARLLEKYGVEHGADILRADYDAICNWCAAWKPEAEVSEPKGPASAEDKANEPTTPPPAAAGPVDPEAEEKAAKIKAIESLRRGQVRKYNGILKEMLQDPDADLTKMDLSMLDEIHAAMLKTDVA